MSKNPLTTKTIRIDAKDVEALQERGIELGKLIRKEVKRILKQDKCPTCGAKLKTPKRH